MRLFAASLPVMVLLVLFVPHARAQDEKSAGAGVADGSACPIGIYVTSLRDFDPVGDSFGIDFWVWSVHEPGENPLQNLEFVNAKQVEVRLDQTTRWRNLEWSRLKARATVLHNWDVSDFPFDRPTLVTELGIVGSGGQVCGLDRAGSGYDENIAPNGWRIAAFDLGRRTVEDATDFGDPASDGAEDQERVFVSIEFERESVVGFVKLVAGVYAAIAIALLTFFMIPEPATLFSGRMAVLVGALFAIVVNMQVSNNILGSLEAVSLVDEIHIVALAYVFAAAVMAVVSRRSYVAGHEDRARRRDAISLFLFGLSFFAINAILILVAAA